MAKKTTAKTKAAPAPPAGNSAGSSERWLPWALAALAFVLFSTGFGNQLLSMDDHSATVDNPAVRDFNLFGNINLGMYAPVTWLGYALAYSLGKDSPLWYHLLSALTHAANVWLVFQLLRKLESPVSVSALAAFFFAIHPVQVEAVAWIAGFSTPLFAFFSLLALCFYVDHTRQGGFSRPYWMALGLFLLACLSKSAAVTLPLTLFVLDLWLKRPLNRQSILEKVPFFVLALAFGIATLYTRTKAGHTDTPADFSVIDRGLMICHTVLFYWKKLLFPTGLSIWYPFEKTGGGWPWSYYAAPFALAALIFLAWRGRRAAPFLWWGVLFYLANIVVALPYATFGTFELRSDRYNYLAATGIFFILASLPSFFREKRPAREGLAWVVLAGLGLMWLGISALRIRDWKDTTTLIQKAIAAEGDNFGKAYLWLGMELGDKGKVGPSIENLSKAIQINPDLADAYKYRGGLYGIAKQYEKSVADLTEYLKRHPEDGEQYYNRGLSLLNLNRPQEAIADFSKTLELRPDFTRAYRARGNAYKSVGETAKGDADLAEFEKRQGTEGGG